MKVTAFSYNQWLGVEMLLEDFLQFCKSLYLALLGLAIRLQSSAYASSLMAMKKTGTCFSSSIPLAEKIMSKAIDTNESMALMVAKVTIDTNRWKVHNANIY